MSSRTPQCPWRIGVGVGLAAITLVLGFPVRGHAQGSSPVQAISIDLAGAEKDSIAAVPDRYTIHLRNLVPQFRYAVSVSLERVSIPPIATPWRAMTGECTQAAAALTRFASVDREEAIPTAVHALELTAAGPISRHLRCISVPAGHTG